MATTSDSDVNASESLDFTVEDVSTERLASEYGVSSISESTDESTVGREKQIDADVESLRGYANQLLSGELPDDVSEAVRKATAAGALARGISSGSQLTRNLTAKDLGLTSLDLQSKGAEVLGSVTEFQESRQQYRETYKLSMAELSDTIRNTDLTEAELAEAKYEFKNKMVLALNEQILDLTKFREDLQFNYASTELEGDADDAAGPLSTIDSLLDQLDDTLDL